MGIVKQEYKKYIGVNPYKGFVPFCGLHDIEHSMEFIYIPLKDVIKGKNVYDFEKFELLLDEIYKRKHTAIIRFYLDYPGCEIGIPDYLLNKIRIYKYEEFGGGVQPKYNNKLVINCLKDFIIKLGLNYDGDRRIAFIEAGLIGHWGEWHTYPDDAFMPSIFNQNQIIKLYSESFSKTLILFRYPNNIIFNKYKVGFHDDSFCYSTLKSKKHHFLYMMDKYKLNHRWESNVIGGEVRPEEQNKLLLGEKTTEDYYKCVKESHASWLLIQEGFSNNYDKNNIIKLSSFLGYDFYISNINLDNNVLTFELINVGVAPIYYKFNCFLIVFNNKILLDYDIRKLLPEKSVTFSYKLKEKDLKDNIYFSLVNDDDVYINLFNSIVTDKKVLLYERD